MPEVDPLFGALMDDGWFPSPAHVMRRAAILDAFECFRPGSLLEMGCGAGRMLVEWDRLGHSGVGVDLDPTARELATRCAKEFGIRFGVSDEADPGLFDYLVATEVLEHVEDPGATLRRWAENLKAGGVALLTVPAFKDLWGKSDEWAGHVRRFEPEEFRQVVESSGLQVQSIRLYGYPLGNLLRLIGNFASSFKMRSRSQEVDRAAATFASGHDRSIENKVAPLLRSPIGRIALRLGIALQRRFNKGHGLVIVARKPGSAPAGSGDWPTC